MKRIGYMCPRTYHFRPRSRMPPPCAYRFRPQSRTPQSCAYHFRPRVGAYCIRPTDVFNRKRTPCICVIHFRAHECLMRFCTYSPRPGSFVGRMLLRPTRGHETFVRVCTYSPRSGSFVGRMQYAPTRGRKWYAWNGVIRARLRETVVRFYGIRDRGHEMVVHIGLSLFFGR